MDCRSVRTPSRGPRFLLFIINFLLAPPSTGLVSKSPGCICTWMSARCLITTWDALPSRKRRETHDTKQIGQIKLRQNGRGVHLYSSAVIVLMEKGFLCSPLQKSQRLEASESAEGPTREKIKSRRDREMRMERSVLAAQVKHYFTVYCGILHVVNNGSLV